MNQKYFLITYGCQMNYSDSGRIAAILEEVGYEKAPKIDGVDLIVVNMCSIRQSAVDRVFGLQPKFKQLRKNNDKLQTVLTGCILKKDRKKFAQYFDYILSIKDLSNWPKTLIYGSSKISRDNYLRIRPQYSSFPAAFVPISNGCNNLCTYCVVPYTRGLQICRSGGEILSEVKNLVTQDYKEIWLLGQNVNSYKSQIQNPKPATINFPELLRMVNDITGKFWIRFTSPHPEDFSNELIEVMVQCQKITPYLNLPVQSGDNKILRNMQRGYTIEDYKNLARKIREEIPDIALSTDVIVGFPGETKTQFENTVKLFREIKFDMAYISQYSSRPDTRASEMEDNIPKEEKRKREKTLTEILKKTALGRNKKYLQKIIEVLPIKWKDGFLTGKSFHYKTVKFKGEENLIGKFQKVKITDTLPWGLAGKII